MQCKKVEYYIDGVAKYRHKKKYESLDAAIIAAKLANSKEKQITKLVAFKCKECFKYHIGRNGKAITEKYKRKLKF